MPLKQCKTFESHLPSNYLPLLQHSLIIWILWVAEDDFPVTCLPQKCEVDNLITSCEKSGNFGKISVFAKFAAAYLKNAEAFCIKRLGVFG